VRPGERIKQLEKENAELRERLKWATHAEKVLSVVEIVVGEEELPTLRRHQRLGYYTSTGPGCVAKPLTPIADILKP